MMFKQLAVASALAATAFASQAAAPHSGGNLGVLGSEEVFFGSSSAGRAQSFNDVYHFSLDGLSSVSGSLAETFGDVSFRSVQLGSATAALLPTTTGYSFSFSSLAAGHHTLTVSGLMGRGRNTYEGSLLAQPVPEPESIAMLLAGLGVVGAAVARRRKLAH